MSRRYRDIEHMDEDEPDEFEFHQIKNKKFKPPADESRHKKVRDKEDYYRRESDYLDDR